MCFNLTATKCRDRGLYLILLCYKGKGEKSRDAFEPEIPRMGAEDRSSKVEGLD